MDSRIAPTTATNKPDWNDKKDEVFKLSLELRTLNSNFHMNSSSTDVFTANFDMDSSNMNVFTAEIGREKDESKVNIINKITH